MALRMRKVLATPWVGVLVCHLLAPCDRIVQRAHFAKTRLISVTLLLFHNPRGEPGCHYFPPLSLTELFDLYFFFRSYNLVRPNCTFVIV